MSGEPFEKRRPMNRPNFDDILPVEFSPLSICRVIWKSKWITLAVWIAVTAGAYFFVKRLPPTYSAQAVVVIESPDIPEQMVSTIVRGDPQDRLNAISQQILSTQQLTSMIDEFGLYGYGKGRKASPAALDRLRSEIKIISDRREGGHASSFQVVYTGPNAVTTANVANRVAESFIAQNVRTREDLTEGTSEFLEGQLREAKRKLDEVEGAVSRYKLSHNGELPQQLPSVMGTLDRLQAGLAADRESVRRSEQELAVLESNLANAEALEAVQARALENAARPGPRRTDAASPVAAAVPARRASDDLQAQLNQLRLRYSEDHPDVRRLSAEVERLRQLEAQQAVNQPPPGPAPVKPLAPDPAVNQGDVAQLRADLQRTKERVSTIKVQIAETKRDIQSRKELEGRRMQEMNAYQGRLERIPVREQEMSQITRDYDTSLRNYQSLLDKKLAAGMAADLERRQKGERFTLVDPARTPEAPIKPNRKLLSGLGSLVGLALGLALGVGLEFRKGQFLGEWELPAGTPVLGRLPYIELTGAASTGARARKAKTTIPDGPVPVANQLRIGG